MKKKTFLGSILLLFTISVFGFFTIGCKDSAAQEVVKGANVGQQLPENSFTALEGGSVTIPPKDGKIAVINLWATWCPPCREEMPELQRFYDKYRDNDRIKFYAINHNESMGTIKDFLAASKYSFPVLLDLEGLGVKMLATRGIPTTVVVDQKGIVVFRKIGPVTMQELETAVGGIK